MGALDWDKARRGAVSAIDGQTEKIRAMVGKPLTVSAMTRILLRSNSVSFDGKLRLKLYTIVGYPGEGPNAAVETDLVDAARSADGDLKNKVVVALRQSHFIPFQKTPMWWVPFNDTNTRPAAVAHPVLYDGRQITVYSGGSFSPSPSRAALSTALQRSGNSDAPSILECARVFASSSKSAATLDAIKALCGHLLLEQTEEAIGNVKTGCENDFDSIFPRRSI